jgi:hypothetical protein
MDTSHFATQFYLASTNADHHLRENTTDSFSYASSHPPNLGTLFTSFLPDFQMPIALGSTSHPVERSWNYLSVSS